MAASIRKIAELADVSVATVSRVMNRLPGVRPETEAMVRKYIEECDYSPKMVKRTDAANIAAIVPWNVESDADWYMGQLIQGMGNYAFAHNFNFGIYPFHVELAGKIDLVRELAQNNIDGVVVLNATTSSQYLRRLHEKRIPYMMVNEDMNGMAHCVVADARNGTVALVRQLLQLGHRKIVFIQGDTDISDVRERTAGFVDTMREAGIDPLPMIRPHTGYDITLYDTGYAAAMEMLGRDPHYTAIIANSDTMALGAIKACNQRGLRIPEDISVAGYDEAPFGCHVTPSLTTIRQPLKRMSELAMGEVHRMIREGFPVEPIRHTVPVELIVRESTGQAPGR